MTIHQQYKATLSYLYEQLPMFQRIGPAAFKKDLGNIHALMEAMGNPHQAFRSIHIAGTNGKGSVAHMLSASLQMQGYKTGLYVSPHYRDFRERIKINGEYISKRAVVDFVNSHQTVIQEIRPSFFEITVAMAFHHFSRSAVDVAVVEVGLGGRLDSTNILHPQLSIITNISYDHQQFLGDTLPEIASEKAGIIKAGVPVIIGETHPETRAVFQAKAAAEKAPITFADQLWEAAVIRQDLSHSYYRIKKGGQPTFAELAVNLHGDYQKYNLQTCLQAWAVLNETNLLPVAETALMDGLAQLRKLTRFIGRWQVLGDRPTVLVDSAHNVGGLALVMDQLVKLPHRQLHLVIGTVADKEVEKVLALLPKNARYYFAKADVPRGLDATILQEKAAFFQLKGRAYSSVQNALRAARRQAEPEDIIFVGGSIFVVAEVV